MKKLRRVLLIVFVVSALALALVACNETAITEHNHRWSEWSVDTATCTQGGTQTRTCTSEGCKAQVGKPATETRTTNALGHNVTSWTHCESDHSKHEGVCSRTDCGVTVTEAHHANAAGTECVNCGAALGGSEQCLHPNASTTSETAATCTSAKIEHWTCPDCVWTEDRTVGTALGHDYTDVAWTPVAGGTHERECARGCGDKQTGTCDNKDVLTGTAATCEAAGRENGTKCSVCGGNETLGEVINALGHDYTNVAWTPVAGGTHERVCAHGCGDKQTGTCDDNDVITGTAATCETAGRENGTKCSVCGGNETLGEVINALGHDEYKTDETAATCTTNKVEHWACHRCDWTDDKEIADTALGHDYTDVAWTPVIGGTHERECTRCDYIDSADCDHNGTILGMAATCTTAGRESGTKCSVCGGNETLGEVIAALGHAWSEWSADTATCIEGGTQTRTCTRDDCDTNDGQAAVDTRTTNALGHDEYKTDEAAATCTTNKVEYWACHRCDWTDDKEIAETALGHDDYKANETAATCTTNKVEYWACRRCDWTDDKEIADTALGHNYTDVAWTPVIGGTHERECAHGCGDKQTGTCDNNDVIVGTATTCEAAGRENGTKCSVCGGNEVEGEVIGALGHSLSVASVTPATCTAAKVNHMACSRCDYTEDQTEGEALGHDFTGTTVVVVPDDATYHAAKCSRCDALDLDNKHAAEWGAYGLTADETQHYQVCKHCDIQSTPADHSATTYTYASNGEHSGECACGKALTEKCELADGINACSVCGRIVGSVNGVGDFTIDFSTYGNTTIEPMTDIIIDGVTINFAKGSSSTNPRYWANDKGMRTYKGNVLTVTAPKGGKITSISFTGSFSSDSAGYSSSSKTWTGSGETVTLNITGSSNFTKMAITFDSVDPCYHDDTVVPCLQSAATCEGTGILQDCFHCANCNLYFTTDACTEILENAVVDALGHSYGDWIDEVAATCVATGTKGHFHCDACGTDFDSEKVVLEDLTIAINPNNHSNLSAVAKQDPTCENVGWNAHYECDGCGKKYETADATEEYDPAIAPLGHDLQYRANGTDKHEQYCVRCDYVEEAEEHTATTWVAETDGHHQVCTVCGLDFNEGAHTYVDGECVVCGMEEAHEHNFTGTVTKQPTCTEKGVTTYACDGCDDTYTEDIDALGHDFTGDVLPITDDATYHAVKCSRCDAFDVDNKHAAEWGEYGVTADETQHYRICKHCDIQSAPVDHSATTYTYASNGEHSGECACGKALTEKCELADGISACSVCGRIVEISGETDATKEIVFSTTGANVDGFKVVFSNGGGQDTLFSGGIRLYAKNEMTITAPEGAVMTKIVFDVNGSGYDLQSSSTEGYDTKTRTWIGEKNEVVFVNSNTKQARFTKIVITYSNIRKCYHDDTVVPCLQSAATCEGTGILQDCYHCENCNLYFTTEACTEILENAVVDALGHNYGEWIPEVAATCAATGTKGHFHCDACGTDFDSEKAVLEDLTIAIDPNNHTDDLTHVDAQAATTCDIADTEHAGHVEYWQCACGVMYADETRNTVIDSLDPIYLDHTPEWTTKTDSGHSGECGVCNATIAEQQHVWNEANTVCTICGYEKPADKHYVTTVIIVDGAQVAGIPAGVTLMWDPADANGAFDAEAIVTLGISLSGYNLVSVVWADSTGNETEDWMEVDGAYMGEMYDDYTLTITVVSIPTAVVNYSVDNATVTVTDSNGTTINNGDRVFVGTELTITVTANDGYEVKSVTVNGTAVVDGKYTIAETDTTITIAATIEEIKENEISITGAKMLTVGKITGTSYTNYTMTGEALGCKDDIKSVTINAAKQTQTITDLPVTKTKAITIEACEGKSITHLGLEFRQWGSKALGTISITITYDGGKTATITGSSDFTQSFDLSEYSNVTKIVVSNNSTSNQAGIAQIDLKVK